MKGTREVVTSAGKRAVPHPFCCFLCDQLSAQVPRRARDEIPMVYLHTGAATAARDPWCPGGVGPRCPCPGAGLKYPMASWRAPNTTIASSTSSFTQWPSLSAQCTPKGFVDTRDRSTCAPSARVEWRPEEWVADDLQKPTLPRNVSARSIDRACEGIVVHVARPEWVPHVRRLYATKYAPSTWTLYDADGERVHEPTSGMVVDVAARRKRKARCVEALRSFTPRVCSLRDVFVHGHARKLSSANGSVYYMPPEVRATQSALDEACPANCRARPTNVVSCGGHAVIGRNLMGVAYFHTLYETLGSIVYALELLQASSSANGDGTRDGTASGAGGTRGDANGGGAGTGPVRLLDNLCIPADGGQMHMAMRPRTCAGGLYGPGPAGFLTSMTRFLGIGDDQLQHYPYVRQWDGPSIHLDRATFDCSAANYRNFWHALKLREAMHARLARPHGHPLERGPLAPPPLDVILLMDRNVCERAAAPARNSSRGTSAGAQPRCHGGRGVRHHGEIWADLEARFTPRGYRTIDFTGSESYLEQAKAFHRAAVVVGPHGAQLANMLFCQKRAAVVEFVSAKRATASALYAGYASSVFGLDYWVVVANSSNGSYDDLLPEHVTPTVELALEKRSGSATRRTGAHSARVRQAELAALANSLARDAHLDVGEVDEEPIRAGIEQYIAGRANASMVAAGGSFAGFSSSVDDADRRRQGTAHAAARGGAAVRGTRSWQTLVGDEESNLVTGYGTHVEAWPTGW